MTRMSLRTTIFMRKNFPVSMVMLALLASVPMASAQWLTQTVVVTNGWTAMYLNVDVSSQPILPSVAGAAIAPGNPIDQIWLWKPPVSYAQYVTSPDAPLTGGGRWLSWSQTNSLNTLGALIPNAAYLIHSTAATNYYWKLQGQPAPPNYVWDVTGLNFIGLPTPLANPPSFENFFAPAGGGLATGALQVYQYVGGAFTTNGANPAFVYSVYSTPVTRGKAYWVSATNLNNPYFGPFNVVLPDNKGLNYASSVGQLTLHLLNNTSNTLTATLTLLPSETPPAGQTPIAGAPPLLVRGGLSNTNSLTYASYYLAASNSYSYSVALPPAGQPGADVAVVLGVNRYAMSATPGAFYAGILRFTDSLGLSQIDVPVSAVAASTAGLWVGAASITNVACDLNTYATNTDGTLVLTATNRIVLTTNVLQLSQFTNPATTFYLDTNILITDYTVSNLVVNTFNLTNYLVATNYAAVFTSLLITNWVTTNLAITTTVTGYYFDTNNQVVWETQNATNAPTTVSLAVTNLVFATNIVASGGPAAGTNYAWTTYVCSLVLITNAPFASPVTTTNGFAPYSQTNSWPTTVVTTPMVFTNAAGGSMQTVLVTGTNFLATNSWVTGGSRTNFILSRPFYVATNPLAQVLAFTVFTNFYYSSTVVSNGVATDWVVVSNFFNLGDTGYSLVASTTNVMPVSAEAAFSGGSANNTYALQLGIFTNYLCTTNILTSYGSNYVVAAHNTSPGAVIAPYPLRLILFNGTNGTCSLLQRVYYGFDVNSNTIVATTQSALDPTRLSVARRISAAQLPWTANNTVWQCGAPLALGSTLTFAVDEPYDDQAANPFLHTYHPDHNNLSPITDPTVPATELGIGEQSYDLSRTITLTLQPNADDFTSLTTASSSLAGIYSETITLSGINGFARSYSTSGSFSVICISQIPTLTTQ